MNKEWEDRAGLGRAEQVKGVLDRAGQGRVEQGKREDRAGKVRVGRLEQVREDKVWSGRTGRGGLDKESKGRPGMVCMGY